MSGLRSQASGVPRLSRGGRVFNGIYVVTITLIAAWLRLRQLAVPSFWFDEIAHYHIASAATKQPLWRWLTFFEIENGPIFYAGQLLGRIAHSPEFSARIAPALCGIAAIPLAWFAARGIGGYRALPHVAALLLASSPLHVYYSREARPYALVVLLTTALLAALLHGARIVILITLFFISLYSGAVVAPVIASVAVTALIVSSMAREKRFWGIVAALSIGCSILLALCYHPAGRLRQEQLPRIEWSFFRGLLENFSVVAVDTTTLHRGAYVFALLALVGAIALLIRSRNRAIVVIAMALLPLAIGVTATWQLHRDFGVRYVIGTLPAYLLLVASGISAIMSQFHRWRIDILASVACAALLAHEGWHAALDEPFRKLDWRTVARAIARHARQNDAVIAADTWTFEQIDFYLRGTSPRVRLFNAGGTHLMGEVFAYQNTTSWLVIGDNTSEFAEWACRFPVILASPLQNFRLHYSPGLPYFLRDRSTGAEQRALLASFGSKSPVLHSGPGEDVFFAEGWGSAEPEEGRYGRWAIGRRARVDLPLGSPVDRTVTLELTPVSYPGSPPQRLTVQLNDQPLQTITLANRRSLYTIAAPRDRWRPGVNQFVFDFDQATAPADVDRRSSDHRPLAARFYEIGVIANGTATAYLPPEASHLVRLDEESGYLNETNVWREENGRPLPHDFDRAKAAHFVARIGFDPPRAIADLESGRVTLASLAASIAENSVCMDDDAFLRTMFPALLNRAISDRERRQFRFELQRGISRSTIVRRLGNSDEVRGQVSGSRSQVLGLRSQRNPRYNDHPTRALVLLSRSRPPRYGQLHRPGGMAEVHGLGRRSLYRDSSTTEPRGLWSSRTDATSRCIRAVQYCGRSGPLHSD